MIYILTLVCSLIGFLYHCMQKIGKLRTKFPEFEPKKVFRAFIMNEWDTFIASALGISLLQIGIYISLTHNIVIPTWVGTWGIYVFSVVWGYGGQRLAYKYLGTAESFLEKKSEELKNKFDK